MMKNYVHNVLLRKRNVGEWITLGVSIYMVILSIVYVSLDGGALKIPDYSKTLAFVMLLVGGIAGLSTFFYDIRFLNSITVFLSFACYSVAAGRQLYLAAYPIADLATGVNWFGGSLPIYLGFFIAIMLGVLVEIVALFFKQSKYED